MYDAPPLSAPAVVVEAARLIYGGVPLFDGLDLALPAGRTTALLGPSGVGKSSLLRLIAGLAHGAEGEVHDGRGAKLDGRVAYMAQQDLLLPWLDLVGNVTIGARLRRARRGRARPDRARPDRARPDRAGPDRAGPDRAGPDRLRAERLLGELGLGDRLTARPAALSGGMRQRVALARTLFEDRAVVLMDEPFSALDAITRHELQALAAERLAGRTVFLVTHDPLEALRLGHAVWVMSGRPARLEAAPPPAGVPPREPGDPALLARQAELLERLGRARAA